MKHLKGILFIDIETVPVQQVYDDLTAPMQKEWDRKAKLIKNIPDTECIPAKLFEDRAGVYSEFAKVVCIGIGSLYQDDSKWSMRLKALKGDDEKVLLNEFCALLDRFSRQYNDFRFCGHNIKEFDIPFLCRRMVINGVELPG